MDNIIEVQKILDEKRKEYEILQEEKEKINKKIEKFKNEFYQIAKNLKVCEICTYDGEFRCEACSESLFYGFNVKDFPY